MNQQEKEQLISLIRKVVRDMATGGGATAFTSLTDVPSSYSGQTLKVVRVNAGETALEFTTLAGGGDMLATNNLSDLANAALARTNLGISTTANQTDSSNKRFMTDAQEALLDAQSGTNTGDNATNTQYSGLAASKLDSTSFSGLAKITVGTVEPVGPSAGDLWIDTN